MGKFFIRRVLFLIPTFLSLTLITFCLVHLVPGDPIDILAGERGIDPEKKALLMEEYGLNKPLIFQYFHYISQIFRGDFGKSIVTGRPVLEEFLILFPATLELSLIASIFALILGVFLGVVAALNKGNFLDHTIIVVSLTGYSMPIFWWGVMMIFFFSNVLEILPSGGRMSVHYWIDTVTGFMLVDAFLSQEKGAFWDALKHLMLPAFVLSTVPMAVLSRMSRASMLEVLGEDYIRTVRAKGVSFFKIIFVHALKNALIPVVTVFGLQVSSLLGGAILTETIFSWPGVGKWLIDGISRRDYAVVQSGLLFIAGTIFIVNMMVDVIYGLINPRMR